MHLLNDFIRSAKSNNINIDLNSFVDVPCNLYLIDQQRKFIDCNESQFKTFGFSKQNDILGMTVYDIAPHEIASVYDSHNQEIVVNKTAKIAIGPVLSRNEKVNYLSYKIPFYSPSKKCLGIIGLSVPVEKTTPSISKPLNKLTIKEKQCLYCLARGMRIKEIARSLNLSPRTIEHRLESIKLKLDCRTRAELISMIIDTPFKLY